MQRVAERIRELRAGRGLSQRALAEAAGISAAALSQIESGQVSPSVATLEKLADGLGVSVAAFFLDADEQADLEILNLSDRPSVPIGRGGRFVPLTALHQPAGFEPMLVQLEPGGRFSEERYGIRSARAFAWIRRGAVVLEYGDAEHRLTETQSAYYDARKPHNWRNDGPATAEILIVRAR